ncbi:MAG: nucleotidyltransferase family protein, partial [Anaerococcus hydrogenalis]|nr:nucleotidyltransferase family protein [Anaerococcus hydrogenalis]
MKKLAIISEYNPFHNGHNYIQKKAKKISNADIIISIMSGDFVQRGEPSLIDKYKRANSALIS